MYGFQTNYPYYRGLYALFGGLLEQFGWQSPFPVAHFGCWTLICEAISAGYAKVSAKISNWLGTRSHRSHLSGALLTIYIVSSVILIFCYQTRQSGPKNVHMSIIFSTPGRSQGLLYKHLHHSLIH